MMLYYDLGYTYCVYDGAARPICIPEETSFPSCLVDGRETHSVATESPEISNALSIVELRSSKLSTLLLLQNASLRRGINEDTSESINADLCLSEQITLASLAGGIRKALSKHRHGSSSLRANHLSFSRRGGDNEDAFESIDMDLRLLEQITLASLAGDKEDTFESINMDLCLLEQSTLASLAGDREFILSFLLGHFGGTESCSDAGDDSKRNSLCCCRPEG
jgi:hypothetical protein